MLRTQKVSDLRGWHRPLEQIALSLGAAARLQPDPLLLGLDPFCRRTDVEAAREVEHRLDDGHRLFVFVNFAHEGLIDLQSVERERAQVGQGRIAGAEIVERDADAAAFETMQYFAHRGVFDQRNGFRDFEFEPFGRQTAVGKHTFNFLNETVAAELQ